MIQIAAKFSLERDCSCSVRSPFKKFIIQNQILYNINMPYAQILKQNEKSKRLET
ncbi:hypothetical protein HanPSC8_Chr16g0699931 [Helianthus annuus]|nr:hypothetical protein HanPSC8_Chr16g0699931 [Helianthus annuus]